MRAASLHCHTFPPGFSACKNSGVFSARSHLFGSGKGDSEPAVKLGSSLAVSRAGFHTGKKSLGRWMKGDTPDGISKSKAKLRDQQLGEAAVPRQPCRLCGQLLVLPHCPLGFPVAPRHCLTVPWVPLTQTPHHCRKNILDVRQECFCPFSDFPLPILSCQSWCVLSQCMREQPIPNFHLGLALGASLNKYGHF